MPDSTRRPTSGRPIGRGKDDTPSARTSSRHSSRGASTKTAPAAQKNSEQEPASGGATLAPRLRDGLRVTQRAVILGVVMVVLLFSYATTLRVYFNQQYRIAEAREQIAQHEQSISSLEDEVERWNDPEYVKIQARVGADVGQCRRRRRSHARRRRLSGGQWSLWPVTSRTPMTTPASLKPSSGVRCAA